MKGFTLMQFAAEIKSAIHWIATTLEIPAIIILIIAVVITILELGSLLVEGIVERRHAKVDVSKLLESIKDKSKDEISAIIKNSRFLRKKKTAFAEIIESEIPGETADALASRLISGEELRCQKIVSVTDIIARVAPMFGLMATLIPLGPGLIALGQGDTQTLSNSLLTAFDATVSGLAAAGVAYIISRIRKRWYEDDLVSMEAVMEGILFEIFPENSGVITK
jgi:biopolymer transport protein ExbB/TolQ